MQTDNKKYYVYNNIATQTQYQKHECFNNFRICSHHCPDLHGV